MPFQPISHVFDAGLRDCPSRSGSLSMLVRQQLEFAAMEIGMMNACPTAASESEDLVSEMGDYFTRTAMLWAQLTEQLVHSPLIAQASHQAHERSKAVSHLSDLSEVARIDVNIAKLRRIRNLSQRFSQEVQEAWCAEAAIMKQSGGMETLQDDGMEASRSWFLDPTIPPFCEPRFSRMTEAASFDGHGNTQQVTSRKLLPNKSQTTRHPTMNANVSDSESSDDEEQFRSIDMDALRQRGKGAYVCPKGMRCDKGGVDKDGKLIVFDRNSSFAQHCNKHRKPWRCDIPGCPNPPKKRRFARRDGLERHKTTVKHYFPT